MSSNIIKLNRGDSFKKPVRIFSADDASKKYLLTRQDAVYFAVLYPHQRLEDALILKGFSTDDQNRETGEITLELVPNDTRDLLPGVYYYTVKLQRGGTLDVIGDYDEPDEVRTIIERTKFIINE